MEPNDDFDKKTFFEQYKLFIEMADRISQRRVQTNQFYLTVLSALAVILSLVVTNHLYQNLLNVLIFVISFLGLLLCVLWHYHLQSYQQHNKGKFTVIHEMEAILPFAMYKREWEVLGEGNNKKIYLPFTNVEKHLPFIMATLYIFLIICAIATSFSPNQIVICATNCTIAK